MKCDYSCICIVVAVHVVMSQGQFDEDPDPDPVNIVDPSPTAGPHALPPSFQVQIEATFIDQQESLTVDEYVDDLSGMSSMNIRHTGRVEILIFNHNTNQTYHIQNNECTVHNLTSDHIPHVYTTRTVLKVAQEHGMMYMGQSTVRGIATDHWQTYMYWGDRNANFTLDYYFTEPNWTTADDLSQIPVRAEVQGYTNIKGPGPVSSFHHIYDYVGFKGYVQDSKVFQTPQGVVCPGRLHTRQMPTLKPQFQYRQEVITVTEDTVADADIWYDFNRKLLRFDHTPTSAVKSNYSQDAVTEIHDYNTGVAYIIDKRLDTCSIVPIQTNSWDASVNTTQGTLHLKTPEELFYLDSSYVYSGQRTVRGITCDVFSTIKINYTDAALGVIGMDVSFEMYFMADDWNGDNSNGDNRLISNTPVRLEIFRQFTRYGLIYDFFDFDQEHPGMDTAFKIAPCFPQQSHIDFFITFPGTSSDLIQENKKVFQRKIVQKLASVMNVRPLRIQSIELHLDKKNMYFVGKLTDRAPALAKFRQSPTKVAQYTNNKLITGVSDVVSCVSACDEQTQATCNSFDYCPLQLTCAPSLQYTTSGNQIGTNKTCDHYTRVISGPVLHEPSLKDAFSSLMTAVVTGNFTVSMAINSSQMLTVSALDITDNVWRKPEYNLLKYNGDLINFEMSPNSQLYDMDYTPYVGVSVEDCAHICLQELVFTCNTFQYEASTGKCALYSLFPDLSKDKFTTTLGIDFYRRYYVSQYIETANYLIQDLNTTSVTLNNVPSTNMCAKECYNNASFTCKTFDFSSTLHTCILHSKRYYMSEDSHLIKSTLWNSYTLDYVKQYHKIRDRDFSMPADKYINQPPNPAYSDDANLDIAFQDCAELCAEETSFLCQSFLETDSPRWTCGLYATSLYDVGNFKTIGILNSFIFNREYYPNGRRYIPRLNLVKPTTPSMPAPAPIQPSRSTKSSRPAALNSTRHPNVSNLRSRTTTSTPAKLPTVTTAAARPRREVNPLAQTQCSPVKTSPCSCNCKGQTTSSTSANDGHTSRVHQTPTPDHESSYPTGTVVGVAFAMLIVGILSGGGAAYFQHRRKTYR